jgi:hypothetical protein
MPRPKPWRSARAQVTRESKPGKIAGERPWRARFHRRRQTSHHAVSLYGVACFGKMETNKDAVPES